MKKLSILFTLTLLLLISSSAGALSSSVNIFSQGTISYPTPSPTPSKATVNILATAGGTTTPAPGTYQYDLNTIVTITATPDSGFRFENWLIDGTSTDTNNPISFEVTTATTYTYQAIFESTTPPIYLVPVPDTPKFDMWESSYRVSTDFMSYVSGTSFDFTGFFSHQYSSFLAELDAVPWSNLQTYTPNAPTWSPPSYQAGEPIGGGNLRDLAMAGAGIVVDGGGTAAINNAINSLSGNQWLVYVEEGVYDGSVVIGRSNVVLAGAGWNTTIRKTTDYWAAIRIGISAENVIVRDLSVDGNAPEMAGDGSARGNSITSQGASRNLVENCFVFDEWAFGFDFHGGSEVYMINNAASNCGANDYEFTYIDHHGAGIGNYGDKWVDVGMSTWGSNNIIIVNNVFENPVPPHWGAFTRTNWAIGCEGFGGDTTYNILIRDNHASDLQGQPDRGSGVHMSPGAHHVVVCRGTYNNNNDCGVSVDGSTTGYVVFYDVHPTGNLYADIYDGCPNVYHLP